MKQFIFTLCIFLVASGCENKTAQSSLAVSEKQAVSLMTAEQIREHQSFLADDALGGRMTGEDGYDDAAAYVARQFAALGLTPGGADGWFQPVAFQSYLLDTERARVVSHRDGVNVELRYREDYGMFADKVRETKSVRAEVVFVGYGVHAPERGYTDYAEIDVAGKIVALFSGGPAALKSTERAYFSSGRVKAKEAYSRGAVGFITLRSRRTEERNPWPELQERMGKTAGLSWLSASGDATDYWPEGLGSIYLSVAAATELFNGSALSFEEARDAAESSRVVSQPLGLEMTIETYSSFSSLTSPNVIGVVKGSDPALEDEYVVYTAHLDHIGVGAAVAGDSIYNGAYDNAMGVALLLEAARASVASPPRRSMMFIALTGEERGLLGSDYFVNYPTVPIESIVANINLDMPLFLFPVGDLVAFGAEHSSLQALVEKAASQEDFVLSPDPVPEEGLFRRSDQYSFVKAGVPSIYLIPGFTSLDPKIDGEAVFSAHLREHYHKPSDDLSLQVHWESAERFARANVRIGLAIANGEERPRWNVGDFFGETFGNALTRAQ